jgi:ABC-type microcin C transport system permease subunit YejE
MPREFTNIGDTALSSSTAQLDGPTIKDVVVLVKNSIIHFWMTFVALLLLLIILALLIFISVKVSHL